MEKTFILLTKNGGTALPLLVVGQAVPLQLFPCQSDSQTEKLRPVHAPNFCKKCTCFVGSVLL